MLDFPYVAKYSYWQSYCMARNLISSDTVIRNIKPGDPRKRLNDGDGLYLVLFFKGASHLWRFDYSIHGRRKTISFGPYPDTTLGIARRLAQGAREVVAAGTDPMDLRRAARASARQAQDVQALTAAGLPAPGTFEAVARAWFDNAKDGWSPSYASKVIRRLEVDVFPWIGARPMVEITPPELLAVMRRIEARGVIETAHRALESCGQAFRYGIAEGHATSDPARDLRGALRKPKTKHMAAIIDPKELGALLRAIHGYTGTPVVRTALQLAPMLMLRPGELRFAAWAEMDLEAATWTVPATRMKREIDGKLNGSPHIVPLPTQAVALLRDLHPLTGAGHYVFRGERDHERAMSENTVNAALRRMGYDTQEEVTGHGFRATARTILEERLHFEPAAIEAQLAHSVKDSNGRAYNRTEFVEQRRAMLQTWADYLDKLRQGADVVSIARAA